VPRSSADHTTQGTTQALTAAGVGERAIRGGALRVLGYGVGLMATAGASVVLLRDLTVASFGRYVVVAALLAIVSALSDAGLTVIGQRAYIHAGDMHERREVMRSLLGLRIALTPLLALGAVAFSVAARYTSAQVAATAIGSGALVLTNAGQTLALPIAVRMRLGLVTVVDVVRQVVLMASIALLAASGVGFVTLFLAYGVSGVATVATAFAVSHHEDRVWPAFNARRWRELGREALPVALGLAINVVYLRLLVILMSLLSTARQTGLYGASFRVIEIFIGIPQIMAGTVFPLLVQASRDDEERLAQMLQLVAEASLFTGAGIAVGLSLASHPIVRILGGAHYSESGTILSLQAFALLGSFLTQVWVLALIAIDRRQAMAQVNAIGAVVVGALGFTLIPVAHARGAAIASIAGEVTLAIAALVLLSRARPRLRPAPARMARIALAAGLSSLCALLPVPDLVRAAIAVGVYLGLVVAFRAHPMELLRAIRFSRTAARAR
jgi:O-antigen/teichoic acid export membrane protein